MIVPLPIGDLSGPDSIEPWAARYLDAAVGGSRSAEVTGKIASRGSATRPSQPFLPILPTEVLCSVMESLSRSMATVTAVAIQRSGALARASHHGRQPAHPRRTRPAPVREGRRLHGPVHPRRERELGTAVNAPLWADLAPTGHRSLIGTRRPAARTSPDRRRTAAGPRVARRYWYTPSPGCPRTPASVVFGSPAALPRYGTNSLYHK